MAKAYVTVSEFISVVPSAGSIGAKSAATVEFTSLPTAGDTIDIRDEFVLPFVYESFAAVAGTPGAFQFQIGADVNATATNLASSINTNSSLVVAAVIGTGLVQIVSRTMGPVSEYSITTSNSSAIAVSNGTLSGGSDLVQVFLDAAQRQVNLSVFGSRASDAHTYLAAHFLTTSGSLSGTGNVSSKRIGDIAVSYAVATPTNAELGSTSWGLMYLHLMKSVPALGFVGKNPLDRTPFKRGL